MASSEPSIEARTQPPGPISYAAAAHEHLDETPMKPNGVVEEVPEPPTTASNGTTKKEKKKAAKKEKTPPAEQNGKIFYEKGQNGGDKTLASVKPAEGFESERRQDSKPKPGGADKPARRVSLVSGRQAGKGWDRGSIRWAPMNVPIKRRLQTLLVLLHTLSIALSLSLFFFLCAIPLFWPLLLPYLLYILFSNAHISGTLFYRSKLFRSSPVWSLYASYFPARLHRSEILPPTRKYIFGYHPHGIISHGAFAAFATEALGFSQLFPGITNSLLTLDSNFRIPIYRNYALAMGLGSVSRESCENILSRGGPNGEGMGRAITIVVGGARESLDAQPHSLRLVLKRRKGFVKLAIRTGADLVPVLGFGENEVYEQLDPETHPGIHRLQLWAKRVLGFTVPLFHARGVFNYDVGLMPYRRPLNIVVGKPVKVVRQERPEPEYVDRIHDEYVTELKAVWDEWKDEFARNRTGELEIGE
ncbi:MAG: diacylglycerol O-acyltransferase 1 [Chaenotheca gracillima]|nr:MAG: diacylglycerol O-acyltransferase 1 [Chaenotheca gracillima]